MNNKHVDICKGGDPNCSFSDLKTNPVPKKDRAQ